MTDGQNDQPDGIEPDIDPEATPVDPVPVEGGAEGAEAEALEATEAGSSEGVSAAADPVVEEPDAVTGEIEAIAEPVVEETVVAEPVAATVTPEVPAVNEALIATSLIAPVASEEAGETPSTSPLDDLEDEKPSRRVRIVGISAAALLAVLGGAYVGGVFYTADRTASEASISGVDVSGLTSAEAIEALNAGLAERTQSPIALTVGDIDATIDPADAGMTIDAEASVAQVTGRSWSPSVLFTRLFGTQSVDAVTAVDRDALTAALGEAQEYVSVPPVDATISFANAQAVVTQPEDGSGLEIEGAADVITQQWLSADGPIELPVTVLTPELDQAALDTAMSTIVDPLLSAPVVVTAGDQSTSIDTATLTSVSTVVGVDGAFALEVNGEALSAIVAEGLPNVGEVATDASFTFVDGVPSIVPSVDGTSIDPAQLATSVAAAAVLTTERNAPAELVGAAAEFSTADAEALGVTTVISEFSTPLPGYPDPPRTENLVIGTGRVTGILVKPGETFSLLEILSPFNAANGYNQSGVVENGFEAKAYGGGLSQLSTTLFNAGFEAGLEDVTHKPHSRWFSRYPEGREATLYEGSVDMQFKNTTDHGVLIRAWVGDGRVHAQLWGTPTFKTEITTGNRYNLRSGSTIYNTRAGCIPESGGQGGFTVDVHRTVTRLDGTPVEDKTLSWTYSPWNRVICGPDPATLPPAPTTPEAPATTG